MGVPAGGHADVVARAARAADGATVIPTTALRSGPSRPDLATAALIVGGAPVVAFAAVLVVATAGLAVGLRVGAWSWVPATAAEIAYVWCAWRAVERASATRRTVATIAVWVVVLVAAGVVASRVADTSTDGRHYHSESVLALAHGWNPIHDPPVHWASTDPDTWTNAYPKGPWIVMAAVVRAGGDLESTKLVGIVLLLGAACTAFGGLLVAGVNRGAAAALAGMAALNPVATVQLFTHMVDGITASLVLTSAVLAMAWVWGRTRPVVILPALGAALVLLANTKFTGIVYGVAIVGGIVVVGGLVARLGRKVLRMAAAVAACLAFAVVVVGFNPYVTNTVRHDSPLYPVYGPNSVDVEAATNTGSLRHMGAAQQVTTSVLSTSQSGRADPSVKVPFAFTSSEWDVFRSGEVRIGGLGPWFGGLAILALVAAASILVAVWRGTRMRVEVWVLLVAGGLCLLSALVTREGFLARLVPQLWLFPPFVIAAFVLARPIRGSRALAWVVIAVLAVDAVGVAAVATRWSVHDSHTQAVSMRALRRLGAAPDVEFGGWERAERRRLADAGVRYHAVARVSCRTALSVGVVGSLSFVNTGFVPRPVSGILVCPPART